MTYRLLGAFKDLFEGKQYRHRVSNQGDYVASYLVDDLYDLDRSPKLKKAVDSGQSVQNARNAPIGRKVRRGDGTYGPRIPSMPAMKIAGYIVSFGEVAEVEIGTEVKILAKAMVKQIDRVCGDLEKQVAEFRKAGGDPISVAIVGINHAPIYSGFEGARENPTDGKTYPHPRAEAPRAISDIQRRIPSLYDECLILRFIATNQPPYEFQWCDEAETEKEYGAALVRIARLYEKRF